MVPIALDYSPCPWTRESTSPGHLLEMQILRYYPDLLGKKKKRSVRAHAYVCVSVAAGGVGGSLGNLLKCDNHYSCL